MPKAVKLHHVGPPASEKGTVGEEPTWDGPPKPTYMRAIGLGMNWYNYLCTHRDYALFMEEWILTHRPNTAKKDLARLHKLSEKEIGASVATMARMNLRGFPLNENHSNIITKFVDDLKRLDKVKGAEKTVSTGPSVQDRMRQQVSGVLSEIDQAVDDMLDNKKVDFDRLRDMIFNPNFKAPHLSIIDKYIKHYVVEWQEAVEAMAQNFMDDTSVQLAEGYAYCGPKMLKLTIAKFSTLTSTLSTEGNKVKMQRIRKKKPVDKKKMVAKLKFLASCKEIGVSSINPVDIIGATTLWVYDCKKRKLGCYEGEFVGSLHIKGTSVLGAKASYQKTLRKPKEQMAEFKKLRKNQTAKFMEAIRAKSQLLTGRTNAELILVRVD